MRLRKMEGALSFFDGNVQLLLEDIKRAVVRHLEIVDACHDTRQVVVRRVWGLGGLADDRKHGCE